MEENIMGTLVINYDKLSKLEIEEKKISKYKEEYEFQLEKKRIVSLHNVNNGLTIHVKRDYRNMQNNKVNQ